jgi:DNA repair protein RAD5
MGKEREEQVAMVRAVLGDGTPEMDIIRALHMAGDDPTKAINILLDFNHNAAPPLPPTPTPTPSPSPSPPPGKPAKALVDSNPPPPPPRKAPTRPMPTAEKSKPAAPTTNGGGGEHWWLVGSAEMAGLSTCKGRRIASGDAVTFTFPNAAAAVGKSRPGRAALASCSSEIMRFSTSSHGEVLLPAPILDAASSHCMKYEHFVTL